MKFIGKKPIGLAIKIGIVSLISVVYIDMPWQHNLYIKSLPDILTFYRFIIKGDKISL